jgi:hydroxyacylglutathione hydrolase
VKVQGFVTGPFEENTYLVADSASGDAILIDPGDEGEALVDAVRRAGLTLRAIWLTHAHIDHIGGIAAVRRALPVPVFLHRDDLEIYENGETIARTYGVPFEQPENPDHWLNDGDELTVGELRFRIMHAPGHAPGHVVIHGHGVAFVGDCLFAGSIGRTDLPLSDGAELARSLARIAELPAETVVYSGHGPSTTIGEELRTNPFLTGIARPVRR